MYLSNLLFCRLILKELLRSVSSLAVQMNSSLIHDVPVLLSNLGNFVAVLLKSLSKVDSKSYYDLPILELTVQCMEHLTAQRGWSLTYSGNGEQLCANMASTLIQVSV